MAAVPVVDGRAAAREAVKHDHEDEKDLASTSSRTLFYTPSATSPTACSSHALGSAGLHSSRTCSNVQGIRRKEGDEDEEEKGDKGDGDNIENYDRIDSNGDDAEDDDERKCLKPFIEMQVKEASS